MSYQKIDHTRHQEYKQIVDYFNGYGKEPYGYKKLFNERDNRESGFYGGVYAKGKNIVVVAKGTDLPRRNDIKNDIAIWRDHVPSQFYDYLEIYKQIKGLKEACPSITITWVGYSLTGNPAQMMSILTGDKAVCFAPFGAADTMKSLDKMYKKSKELQELFPNYKGIEKADTSNIVNYYCIDDIFSNFGKIDKQLGSVFIVPQVDGIIPHMLYNWGDLTDAVPWNEDMKLQLFPRYFINQSKDRLYGYVENTRDNIKNKIFKKSASTGQAANISDSSGCTGSYPVSGYTRGDGTKVSGYTRNCYKHGGSLPKLNNLSKEEIDYWVAKFI